MADFEMGNIFFISTGVGQDLADVAMAIFRAVGVRELEERFSSNYPPEDRYFAGYAENAEVKVYVVDGEQKPGFPFRAMFKAPSWRKGPGTIIVVPTEIATSLAAAGLNAFIPDGRWYDGDWDGKGVLYAAWISE